MSAQPHQRIETEGQAAAWLEGLIDVEKRPDWPYRRMDLLPIRRLLARLGEPQRGLRVVHIAGSKGKGSTALFAEAVVRAAGVRVGTFTSPHLERWTERFRIDGGECDGERLAAAVEALRPHVEELRGAHPEGAPTFFDATTAAALLLFREAEVGCAILEVGLGGRLDSTNVVQPAATCITSIELEHTDRLGTSLAAIASEKAGILKPGAPAVVGVLPEEAREAVARRAAAIAAPVAWLGKDFGVEAEGDAVTGLAIRIHDGPLAVETTLSVPGFHQASNAALAVACLRRAGVAADAPLEAAAVAGLAGARLPGRIEVLSRRPWVVVDAAHTAASARALSRVLALAGAEVGCARSRPVHLVLSISGGKDLAAILRALLPCAARVTVTRAEAARSLDPAEIAAAVRAAAPDCPLRVVPNPHLAVRAAAEALAPDAGLVVAGSVYLAGIARRVLLDLLARR